jgi:hypothetical protein
MRAATRMPTPQAPAAGARRGLKAAPHGPSLRSAWCARRAAPAPCGAERSDGTYGRGPFARAEKRRAWGGRVPQDTRLCGLTAAVVRTERRRRAVSSAACPRTSIAGCPARSVGVTGAGRLSLLTFFRRSERK